MIKMEIIFDTVTCNGCGKIINVTEREFISCKPKTFLNLCKECYINIKEYFQDYLRE